MGLSLTTFNGRDAEKDAIEELVDLSVYLTQLRMEHQAYRKFWPALSTIIHRTIPERVAWGYLF